MNQTKQDSSVASLAELVTHICRAYQYVEARLSGLRVAVSVPLPDPFKAEKEALYYARNRSDAEWGILFATAFGEEVVPWRQVPTDRLVAGCSALPKLANSALLQAKQLKLGGTEALQRFRTWRAIHEERSR